jgi:transcriptional regulator with XRE-family HTH domain
MVSTADSPRARALGAGLRAAREQAKLSQTALAEQLGRHHSHISRWENGKLVPSEADVGAVLGILGVTGDERDELIQLVHDASDPNWVAPGVEKQLAALMDYERTARTITDIEPLMVPGLLQIPDYARSIMIGAGATRGEADQRIVVRMGRQNLVLSRKLPFEFVAMVGEHALRYPPCDPPIMVEQLRHLLHLGQRPQVSIMVLPLSAGYLPALEGPFVLLEFDNNRKPVVYLEHYRSATALTDGGDVRDYQAAVDATRRKAMSPDDSAELIARLADKMECIT